MMSDVSLRDRQTCHPIPVPRHLCSHPFELMQIVDIDSKYDENWSGTCDNRPLLNLEDVRLLKIQKTILYLVSNFILKKGRI